MVVQIQTLHSSSFLRGQRDGQLLAEDCPGHSESELRAEAELQLRLLSSMGVSLGSPSEYVQGLFAGYHFNPQQFIGNFCGACLFPGGLISEYNKSCNYAREGVKIMDQTPEAAASTIGFTMGYGYAIRAVSPQGKTPDVVECQMTQDGQFIAIPLLQPLFRQRWRKGYHCWHIQQIAHAYVESTFPGQQFVCGETRQQGDDEHSPWRCEFLVEDSASGQKVPYCMQICWIIEVEGIAVNWWMISSLEKKENVL